MKLTEASSGQTVRITAVAFPNLPHHSRFLGQTGTVTRIIKSRKVVVVQTNIGSRECNPENIEPIPP